ncbi:MAG: alpha-glucan family phosphorylase [Dehalococcoidia bacterium]|nr:alpha-glucan family phosphorylase [Dehalococcoidia bacterium]
MSTPAYYLVPPLPQGLESLVELALDMRWSWSHTTDRLWEHIDPELWAVTGNPWLILQTVGPTRLKALESDAGFRKLVDENVQTYREASEAACWFPQAHPEAKFVAAYFSMEFGLSEALPIYSGGLGVLAGDYLKTASDLGVPVVGVGLLYQQGYFRQALDAQGRQMEFYPSNDPSQLPVMPVRDANGAWLRVDLDFPGRRLRLRAWEVKVGRVKLYLLDSNDPANSPPDRGVTSELYGGGPEIRLQQEIVLGIGGWRLLRSLGVQPEVCHLNEGHAALAVIERARDFMERNELPFDVALTATRAGNIFTTHTPVEAGFDRFPAEMVRRYLGPYADRLDIGLDGLLALGRKEPGDASEPLNMAYLAIRGSGVVNGVSRLHGEVSRRIFQPLFPRWPQHEVPITHITNGVHMPSWDSAAADDLWQTRCGKQRWLGTMGAVEDELKQVPDETLWAFRTAGSQQLVRYARERLARQLAGMGASAREVTQSRQILDPNVLTVGFARRFTGYKRPNLLLSDPDRLARILNHPQRPMQLIVAGKAHPKDEAGKQMISDWSEFVLRPDVRRRAVFLADYDIGLAGQLVQGVDLWINTSRRPWEASGTSGMKVLVNGGLNLSEIDGWWAEAYRPEVGWAIGDGQEHDTDPVWDAQEAEHLYHVLQEEVVPCFYDRDASGIPRDWVARIRASMAELTPYFSSNRMLREYAERFYVPAAQAFRSRAADEARKAAVCCGWRQSLEEHWPQVHFGRLEVKDDDGQYTFKIPVYLDDLGPDAVQVQLYAEPLGSEGGGPDIRAMNRGEALAGSVNGYMYSISIPAQRAAADYTPRVVPCLEGIAVPLEAQHILWYK